MDEYIRRKTIVKIFLALAAVLSMLFIEAGNTSISVDSNYRDFVHIMANPVTQNACSITMIKEGLGISAAHCGESAVLVDETYKVTSFEPFNDGRDLALVRVEGLPCPCAEIGTWNGEQDATIVGFPLGIVLKPPVKFIIDGKIFGKTVESDESVLAISATVVPGMSGGGVFVEQDGKHILVGIVSRGGPGIVFASIP